MSRTPLEEFRAAPLLEVAQALGLEKRRNSLAPCPACGAERRGSDRAERRGPIGVRGDRWRCFRPACPANPAAGGRSGDNLALAMFVLFGRRLDKSDRRWPELWAWGSAHGFCAGSLTRYDTRTLRRPPPRHPPPPPTLARPPREEVETLWHRCRPVTADEGVCAWLIHRCLDPHQIERMDLVRALPVGQPLYSWAGGRSWRWDDRPPRGSSWRCVFPVYGHTGELESLRARSILLGASRHPKTLPASCGPGSASGLVLANGLGRRLLRGHREPVRVIIHEGEPDFLTGATFWAGGEQAEPIAVFGIWSGAWSLEIAERVPDGAEVIIRTDVDDTGNLYARKIERTLQGRCHLRRLKPHLGEEDSSDG